VASESALERLAYDLSLRALQEQEAVLVELRARAGVLLAANALVTSFLGGRALSGALLLSALGLLAALGSILLCIYVVAPTSNVSFAVLPIPAYEYFIRSKAELSEALETLVYWNQEAWENNQSVIGRLINVFGLACGALVIAVVLWSLELAIN
jgi:hypothetical protein